MPIGNHLAHCGNCGREWIVGDCIPVLCPKCERLEHGDNCKCIRCVMERIMPFAGEPLRELPSYHGEWSTHQDILRR